MVTTESELNTTLGILFKSFKSDWHIKAEQTRQLKSGAGKRVDILVIKGSGTLIAIETEFAPAYNVERDAFARIDEEVEGEGKIETAIAVKAPALLKNYSGDELKNKILEVQDFHYAVLTIKNEANRPLDFENVEKKRKGESYTDRFPKEGWLIGSVKDLAILAQGYTIPPDAINTAADIIEKSIGHAEVCMERYFGKASARSAILAKELLQTKDEKNTERRPYQQIYRMTAAIILNAMIFQEILSQRHDIKSLQDIRDQEKKENFIDTREKEGDLFGSDVIAEWYKILEINYHPIFIIAINMLTRFPSPVDTRVLTLLEKTVKNILLLGVEKTPGLFGIVFQRLIADRKFLATFYTRPEAAVLLANLAIPEQSFANGKEWGDMEAVKKIRVADFACGTGTLLGMAYARIAQLFELHGGKAADIHKAMMENVMTGFDVMPAGVHLTAATLAGFKSEIDFDDTNLYTLAFGGKLDDIKTGSLELLDRQSTLLLPPATFRMRGKEPADTSVEKLAPDRTFDLVIMNPPYTRATNHAGARAKITNPAFAAFGMNEEQQNALAQRTAGLLKETRKVKSRQAQISAAHGNAGLGSYFFEIADIKVREGGQLAMVLPLSFIVGESWRGARQLIASRYEGIMIVTITQSATEDCAFSADTNMAECLLLARKKFIENDSKKENKIKHNRIASVALKQRPRNIIEASEIARTIKKLQATKNVNCLEDGPIGGSLIKAGKTSLGQILDVPLDKEGFCPALAIQSPDIMQSAWQLAEKNLLWLPGQAEGQASAIPTTTIGNFAKRGPLYRDINEINFDTGKVRGPFEIEPIFDKEPTYLALWNHDVRKERFLVVAPDKQAVPRKEHIERAHKIWETASRVHHSIDCAYHSHSLIVALTKKKSLGGVAWPSLYDFPSEKHEYAFALWCNSTLGLLCHLYKANLQHGGRGRTTTTQIPSFPTLDVTDQRVDLVAAEKAFLRLQGNPLLPLYKADEDENRHEIDKAVIVDMLGLNPDLLAPEGAFTQLRKKICNEPAIHGGKKS